MPCCLEVVVPGPWWNTLTYTFDMRPSADSSLIPKIGARVRVPLGRGERVGFVAGRVGSPPEYRRGLRAVNEVLDENSVLGDELWGLAGWMGRTFLCGMGEALQVVCPKPLLQGDALVSRDGCAKINGEFREVSYYDPRDDKRFSYYRERLLSGERRTLLLFPEGESAKAFWSRLPEATKPEVLLWPSTGGKKLWDSWKKVHRGEVRVVVGAGGAVFAPLDFDEVIVDDECNPGYVFLRAPRISARSLAGMRAKLLKASLLLAGRMPSAKTFLRTRPECTVLPRRSNYVFVDMSRSFDPEIKGVEGTLPITKALLERTRATLEQGRHVLWIMDRKGQAGEVYCSDCGSSLFCPRCGSVMRSEDGGLVLRCIKCGAQEALPAKCPSCKGALLQGKRPGLEALLPLAIRYIKGHPVRLDSTERKHERSPSLILGTRRVLALCDTVDVGLAAWLDLDAEARKIDYNARFQTFSMVWESYWRGLNRGEKKGPQTEERLVLMQSRCPGSSWQSTLWLGWGRFWRNELAERKSLNLPPYGLLVQIDLPEGEDRSSFVRTLEKANLFVMDAGDGNSPLWTAVKSTEALRAALASRFEIKHSRIGFPVVTVWAD